MELSLFVILIYLGLGIFFISILITAIKFGFTLTPEGRKILKKIELEKMIKEQKIEDELIKELEEEHKVKIKKH